MEKFKYVIIDAEESCNLYRHEFEKETGVECVATFYDGKDAESGIVALNPDVVIMELLLPSIDGFEIINKIKGSLPSCKIIVVSNLNSATYVSKAMDLGVDYFMIKPIDSATLVKRAMELVVSAHSLKNNKSKKLEEKITNIFLTVGIPAHIKGYQFLREAIKMAVNDPMVVNNITKKLYPGIAQVYSTTASKVERAIRHAIEVAWNKGKIENINDVFGLRVYDTHEKPTNGEFIALVADKMLLEKW